MSNTRKPTDDGQHKDDARQAEATGTHGTVEFNGQTFTVPRDYDEMTVDFIESIEEGKVVGIVRGALGPDQWRRVRATNPKMKDLAPLAEKIAEAMGFSSTGESQASSD